ncbi:MAG: WYL domain-containing protein [Proteobacteria bacterium]|nr:WYL domain-containing protein [Pseudomonadota bacterium]
MLAAFSPPYVRAGRGIIDDADRDGGKTVKLPVGPVDHAAVELVRFGADVEILDPPELRARMQEIAAAMTRLYSRHRSHPRRRV